MGLFRSLAFLYQTFHLPIRIAEMFPMTPKTLKSQIITPITTTTFNIFFSVAKTMFSGFAELGRSLFVGLTQILHGRIDT